MKSIFINALLLFVLSVQLQAQAPAIAEKKPFFEDNSKGKYALKASMSDTRFIALFSFGSLETALNPIRPNIGLSLERTLKTKNTLRQYLLAELAFHDYTYLEKAMQIGIGYGRQQKLYKGLFINTEFVLGFQLWRRADLGYVYNGTVWEPKIYPGKWNNYRGVAKMNLELGYSFKKIPLDLMVGSHISLLVPQVKYVIPFGLQYATFKVGARWRF